MATVKVTVTLPEEQLARIRGLVENQTARSVSGFVQHAVAVVLADLTEWQVMLDEALAETGGPVTPEEREWADGVLGLRADGMASTA